MNDPKDPLQQLNDLEARPRQTAEPYEFQRLGEAIAASLLQTAQQQLMEAENLFKQTEALAEGLRAQVQEQASELLSMHARLKSLGEAVFDAHRKFNGK